MTLNLSALCLAAFVMIASPFTVSACPQAQSPQQLRLVVSGAKVHKSTRFGRHGRVAMTRARVLRDRAA